jgi:pyruvate/2-oxoacid:ferredoxin oxidoreductase beta subunit
MTNLARIAGLASGAALVLTLAACNKETTAENQVEAQADAIEKGYDADAALTEARAKDTPGEEQAEKQADALRDKGDAVEDHLKKEADEMGDDTAKMPKAMQPKD